MVELCVSPISPDEWIAGLPSSAPSEKGAEKAAYLATIKIGASDLVLRCENFRERGSTRAAEGRLCGADG